MLVKKTYFIFNFFIFLLQLVFQCSGINILGSLVGSLVPEELQPVVSTVTTLTDSGSIAPQCKDIVINCLTPGGLGCGEQAVDCMVDSAIGSSFEATLSDLGEIDLESIINELAAEGNLEPRALLKTVLKKCYKYLPPSWNTALSSIVGTIREDPYDGFVCSALVGRNVGQYFDDFNVESTCEENHLIEMCDELKSPPLLKDVFGIYLGVVSGGSDFRHYIPGSLVDSLSSSSAYTSQRFIPGSSITMLDCLTSGRRTACIAAGILAEACERPCVRAHCLRERFHDECIRNEDVFYKSVNKKCYAVARAMNIHLVPMCRSFASGLYGGVHKILLLGITMTFILLF